MFNGTSLAAIIFFLGIVLVFKSINVVPQQHAWVVERWGKYHATLGPGLNIVLAAIDESAENWGVKVLRYEIKDLTPPREILHAMQAQITAEREKRALIASSEGRRQEQINIANGEREAFIARSEGEKQAAINNCLLYTSPSPRD